MNARPNTIPAGTDIDRRLAMVDWADVVKALDARGCTMLEALLLPAECRSLAALYDDDTFLLFEPERDFCGGEFVLIEQRPRMQSRPEVVPLRQGDAVIFAAHQRPVQGRHGSYRVNLRHGVSRVRRGHRHTLGIIFHDAT